MFNLIRMNFYRMMHTKCIYVILIITILFAIFSVGTIESAVEMMEDAGNVGNEGIGITVTGDDEAQTEYNFGIYSEQPILPDGTIKSFIDYLYSDISSGIILMFLSIATVLFVNGESKTGFVKNIAVNTKTRVGIYCAKVIALFGYTLITMFVFAITEYITLMIHYRGDVKFGIDTLTDNAHIFLLQILIHIAFLSGLILLTTVTKSSTLSNTIGMLTITGFAAFFITPMEKLLNIEIYKYTLHSSLLNVDFGAENEILTTALVVGIATIIVYNVLGNLWVTKRDVV